MCARGLRRGNPEHEAPHQVPEASRRGAVLVRYSYPGWHALIYSVLLVWHGCILCKILCHGGGGGG